ncbi:MAG: Crp/Fnr family transcriptional regulator [Alkalispirochaeta sp.]
MSDNPLFDKYGQTISDRTPIFQEGDVGEKMYIIQSGVIRITKRIDGKDHLLAELGKGEFFGEMAIVSNIKRSATATASGTVEILAFDRPGFEAMISKNTKIAMSVIDKLSQRLQNANAQIQQLLRRNERSMIALNLYNRFMEKESEDPVLTFDKTVETIALELQSPQDLISEVLYGFDTAGICKVEGNGIRLQDTRRLVALATVEGS